MAFVCVAIVTTLAFQLQMIISIGTGAHMIAISCKARTHESMKQGVINATGTQNPVIQCVSHISLLFSKLNGMLPVVSPLHGGSKRS